MCPLISNIFLPEAKTRSNIFQLVFLSLKKIHPWNNESEIYYHYSHKRKLFHFLSLGMSISITFFFLYEMSVYWSVSIWYAWGERRIILSVDCSPQYESGRTPSPQGTWPSVLLISTNKRRYFYCITVFHWPTLGGWCINDIFLNEVGEANILIRWHSLFILTSFSTWIQIKKYELIFQSSIMTYTDKLNVIIWVLMYWRNTHLQYEWICLNWRSLVI